MHEFSQLHAARVLQRGGKGGAAAARAPVPARPARRSVRSPRPLLRRGNPAADSAAICQSRRVRVANDDVSVRACDDAVSTGTQTALCYVLIGCTYSIFCTGRDAEADCSACARQRIATVLCKGRGKSSLPQMSQNSVAGCFVYSSRGGHELLSGAVVHHLLHFYPSCYQRSPSTSAPQAHACAPRLALPCLQCPHPALSLPCYRPQTKMTGAAARLALDRSCG